MPFLSRIDVCYNFCYREPHNAIELLLHWFIASEIGIANSIQRVRKCPASVPLSERF